MGSIATKKLCLADWPLSHFEVIKALQADINPYLGVFPDEFQDKNVTNETFFEYFSKLALCLKHIALNSINAKYPIELCFKGIKFSLKPAGHGEYSCVYKITLNKASYAFKVYRDNSTRPGEYTDPILLLQKEVETYVAINELFHGPYAEAGNSLYATFHNVNNGCHYICGSPKDAWSISEWVENVDLLKRNGQTFQRLFKSLNLRLMDNDGNTRNSILMDWGGIMPVKVTIEDFRRIHAVSPLIASKITDLPLRYQEEAFIDAMRHSVARQFAARQITFLVFTGKYRKLQKQIISILKRIESETDENVIQFLTFEINQKALLANAELKRLGGVRINPYNMLAMLLRYPDTAGLYSIYLGIYLNLTLIEKDDYLKKFKNLVLRDDVDKKMLITSLYSVLLSQKAICKGILDDATAKCVITPIDIKKLYEFIVEDSGTRPYAPILIRFLRPNIRVAAVLNALETPDMQRFGILGISYLYPASCRWTIFQKVMTSPAYRGCLPNAVAVLSSLNTVHRYQAVKLVLKMLDSRTEAVKYIYSLPRRNWLRRKSILFIRSQYENDSLQFEIVYGKCSRRVNATFTRYLSSIK